jgi:crotonobetainyl-CoA:carnitine CoA-transferase CaiB-like acyl-CoA transferase
MVWGFKRKKNAIFPFYRPSYRGKSQDSKPSKKLAMQQSFFQDLTVVELSSVLAGPAVGMFFAETGARVIKVENPATGGDITRRWKLKGEDPEQSYSAYYASVNWGKETVFLDLKEGADELEELLRQADIVITNFKAASARKLGIEGRQLRQRFPQLIVAELTGFGADDPRPAFDVVLQAETGFLHMTGYPDGRPAKMPVALIDLLAAHQLKEGILMALLQRERSGKGALVQVSLYQAALASLANQATNWLMAGHIPQRMGTQHPNIAPYGDLFTGSDGKELVLAVGTERQFEYLCQIIGHPEWPNDSRFSTNTERVVHRKVLCQQIQMVIGTQPRDVWMEKLLENGVPAGAVLNMQEVFNRATAESMVLEEVYPDGKPTRRVATVGFTIDPA